MPRSDPTSLWRRCKERPGICVKNCKAARTRSILLLNVEELIINRDLTIPAAELRWRAVRASGPGGQNVNKVATKVELTFDLVTSQSLPDAVKSRLRRLAARYLDADGCIVITCQNERMQRQNLEQARELLVDVIARALVTPRKRKKTKPSAASKAARLRGKRLNAEKKQSRKRVSDD